MIRRREASEAARDLRPGGRGVAARSLAGLSIGFGTNHGRLIVGRLARVGRFHRGLGAVMALVITAEMTFVWTNSTP